MPSGSGPCIHCIATQWPAHLMYIHTYTRRAEGGGTGSSKILRRESYERAKQTAWRFYIAHLKLSPKSGRVWAIISRPPAE